MELWIKISHNRGVENQAITFRQLNDLLLSLVDYKRATINIGNLRKSDIISIDVFIRGDNKNNFSEVFKFANH